MAYMTRLGIWRAGEPRDYEPKNAVLAGRTIVDAGKMCLNLEFWSRHEVLFSRYHEKLTYRGLNGREFWTPTLERWYLDQIETIKTWIYMLPLCRVEFTRISRKTFIYGTKRYSRDAQDACDCIAREMCQSGAQLYCIDAVVLTPECLEVVATLALGGVCLAHEISDCGNENVHKVVAK